MLPKLNCLWLMGCLFFGMVVLSPAFAQDDDETTITLVNGATVKGKIVSISDSGLDMQVGRAQRTYPWYSIAPGTRFRLEQSFRMNLDGYLAGRDRAALTNAPDPQYDPMNPNASTDGQTEVAAATNTFFNFNAFEPRLPVKPVRQPAVTAFPVGESAFWAFQSGPTSNDVIVFAFSTGDVARMATAISWRGRPLTETATRRNIGNTTYLSFSKKTYSGNAGDIAFKFDIEWLAATSSPVRRFLIADVQLTRGTESSSFVLSGEPAGFSQGGSDILPRALFMEPTFRFGTRIENELVYLTGRARMSLLNLIPKSGMDTQATVELFDAQGKSQWRQRLTFSANGQPDDPTLQADISQLRGGQTYKLTATMSLGPLLDEIRHEELINVPDPLKP